MEWAVGPVNSFALKNDLFCLKTYRKVTVSLYSCKFCLVSLIGTQHHFSQWRGQTKSGNGNWFVRVGNCKSVDKQRMDDVHIVTHQLPES